jgi:mevalonate kinase
LNNEIIQAYIHKDVEIAKAKIKQLSLLQYENFKEMIPTPIATIWKEGLDSGAYSIKLCGAGGGGYFMGFGDPSSIKDYEVIAF